MINIGDILDKKQQPLIGERRIKILIGTPCGTSILAETAMFISRTVSRLRDIGMQSGWAKSEGTYVHQNQNALVQMALDTQADILLLIDSDMSGDPTVAERLVKHNLDIVGCDYRIRNPPHVMAAKNLEHNRPTAEETGLEEMDFIASGMMMIRRRVLTTLKFPWFFLYDGEKPSDFVGNDINFCWKARAAGFKIWCDHDLSNEVEHNATLPLIRKDTNEILKLK